MLGRLGNVIYWLFTGLAILMAAGAVYQWTHPNIDGIESPTTNLIIAAILYMIGAAARYVLGGRTNPEI